MNLRPATWILIAALVVGAIIGLQTAHAATIPASRAEHTADRILAHHPYLDAYMDANPLIARPFVKAVHRYPHRMTRLIANRHYDSWLLRFLRTHGGLPGIDLLLGA